MNDFSDGMDVTVLLAFICSSLLKATGIWFVTLKSVCVRYEKYNGIFKVINFRTTLYLYLLSNVWIIGADII